MTKALRISLMRCREGEFRDRVRMLRDNREGGGILSALPNPSPHQKKETDLTRSRQLCKEVPAHPVSVYKATVACTNE